MDTTFRGRSQSIVSLRTFKTHTRTHTHTHTHTHQHSQVHGDNDSEDLDSAEVNSGLRLLTKWDRSGVSPKVQWDLRDPLLLSLDGSSSIVKNSLTDLERRSNTRAPTWTVSSHLLSRARRRGGDGDAKANKGTEKKSDHISCIIHSLGTIDQRKGYYDSRSAFPIGYSCSVPFVSLRAENTYAMLNMTIKEGHNGPIFVASQTFETGTTRYISFEAST